MFHTIRHIARRVTPVLMVLFFVVLAADEYYDTVRALEDLRIESCMELEAYDFEWDDDNEPVGVEQSAPFASTTVLISCAELVPGALCSSAMLSDEQLLGLVRRYAPRKGMVCANCVWI